MAVVVADSFPVRRSSCIIREFAATHIERVTCSNFGFPLAERITIFAPLELFPIFWLFFVIVKSSQVYKDWY